MFWYVRFPSIGKGGTVLGLGFCLVYWLEPLGILCWCQDLVGQDSTELNWYLLLLPYRSWWLLEHKLGIYILHFSILQNKCHGMPLLEMILEHSSSLSISNLTCSLCETLGYYQTPTYWTAWGCYLKEMEILVPRFLGTDNGERFIFLIFIHCPWS